MKIFFAVSILVCTGGLLWAEGNAPPAKTQPETDRPQRPVSDSTTLRMSLPYFEPSFNPQLSYTSAEAQLYINLHESLTVSDPQTLKATPGLASSWTVSDDRLTYKFTIRDNAYFSDGSKITANDFVESWLALLREDREVPFASLLDPIVGVSDYHNGTSSKKPEFYSEGADTLVLRLKYPSPQIVAILSHHSLSVIHKSLRNLDDWSALPANDLIGSGAYRITGFADDVIHLQQNPYYYQEVRSKKVEILLSDDEDFLVEQYNARQLDWISNSISLKNLDDYSSIQIAPLFITTFFYFRSDRPVWKNAKVRKALLLLLPIAELRRKRQGGDARLVPPIPNYPQVDGFEDQDVATAFRLLEEAGYPEGHGLPELVIQVSESFDQGPDSLLGMLRQGWKESIDLTVRFQEVSDNDYLYSQKNQNDFDMGLLSWIGDYPDPMAFLQLWQGNSSLNLFQFNDRKYDQMLEEANREEEWQQRWQQLAAAEEYLLDQAVLLPINHAPAVNIVNIERINGWYNNVLDVHPLRSMLRKSIIPKSIL